MALRLELAVFVDCTTAKANVGTTKASHARMSFVNVVLKAVL